LRGGVAFPAIKLGSAEIFFLPDAVLVVSGNSVAALHYRDLEFSSRPIQFIEESGVPSDAEIVSETWRCVNKSGGPDRRFNSNRQLPVCKYGEMDFGSAGGLNGKMQFSNVAAGQKFTKAIQILIKYAAADSELSPFSSYAVAKNWPLVAFLSCAVLAGAALGSVGILTSPTLSSAFSHSQSQPQPNSSAPDLQKTPVGSSGNGTQVPEHKIQGGPVKPPLDISPTLPTPPSYRPAQIPPQTNFPLGGRY
jgi:hypothetical protein